MRNYGILSQIQLKSLYYSRRTDDRIYFDFIATAYSLDTQVIQITGVKDK